MKVAVITPHMARATPDQGWVEEKSLFVLQNGYLELWEQLKLPHNKRMHDWPADQIFGPNCLQQRDLWNELKSSLADFDHVIIYLSWASGTCGDVIEFLADNNLDAEKAIFMIPLESATKEILACLKQHGFNEPHLIPCKCNGYDELRDGTSYYSRNKRLLPEWQR